MMKNMNKPPLYLFFAAFLLVGFLLGSSAARSQGLSDVVPPTATAQTLATSTTAPNGQQNLLIIGVDDLESQTPRLESIWLLLYISPTPKFTLIPLYPSSYAGGVEQEDYLENTFRLGDDLKPDLAFLVAVQSIDIWWNHYVILDENAIAEIINLSSGDNAMNDPSFGSRTVANLPLAWENPEAAVLAQAELLNGLCHDFARNGSSKDLNEFLKSLNNHVSSDLNTTQLGAALKSLIATGSERVQCQFPTINDALTTISLP